MRGRRARSRRRPTPRCGPSRCREGRHGGQGRRQRGGSGRQPLPSLRPLPRGGPRASPDPPPGRVIRRLVPSPSSARPAPRVRLVPPPDPAAPGSLVSAPPPDPPGNRGPGAQPGSRSATRPVGPPPPLPGDAPGTSAGAPPAPPGASATGAAPPCTCPAPTETGRRGPGEACGGPNGRETRGRGTDRARGTSCGGESPPVSFPGAPIGTIERPPGPSLAAAHRDRDGDAAPVHRTRMPGRAPSSTPSSQISRPPGPAASTIPSETPKRIFRGARLATTTTRRPASAPQS